MKSIFSYFFGWSKQLFQRMTFLPIEIEHPNIFTNLEIKYIFKRKMGGQNCELHFYSISFSMLSTQTSWTIKRIQGDVLRKWNQGNAFSSTSLALENKRDLFIDMIPSTWMSKRKNKKNIQPSLTKLLACITWVLRNWIFQLII